MKNNDKRHSASEFPNIYRFITENSFFKKLEKSKFGLIWQSKLKKSVYFMGVFLAVLISILLTFLIIVFSLKIYQYYISYQKTSVQRQKLQSEINFWQSVSDRYDGYKDAYFRIAFLEYQLGDFNKAKDYNKKALLLDPNFEDAKKLEEILDKSSLSIF